MIQTINLSGKNYSTSNSMIIDNDLLDVNDFIVCKGRTYFANKKNKQGVGKQVRYMI